MDRTDSFFTLLDQIKAFDTLKSQDFIGFVMPLLQEVRLLHELNLTGHIIDIDQIYFTHYLSLNTEGKPLRFATKPLFVKKVNDVLEVDEDLVEKNDIGVSRNQYSNTLLHFDEEKPILKPVYLLNYKVWDYELGHYDPLTDCFVLGQMLASLAFGLDFRKESDLELFVNNRKRLYFLNKDLHPTILNVIYEMTNLYREDRTANLEEIITKLNNYREYNPENYVDLTETEGFRSQDIKTRDNWILSKLKNRLFDISRRNKLLYFNEKTNFLNLTIASVPLLLDHNNIKDKDIIYWNEIIQNKVTKAKKIKLNEYLDLGNNRFLAPTINKIRLEARKSKNEYGFSQLRTVIAFLHWYNFKEDGEEKITSPLLLIPTDVVKKKGVTDQYILNFPNGEAEINPILSHYLKDLYGIKLPDFIDLETTSIEELVQSIQNQISEGGTGITLEWRQKPRIQIIHSISKRVYKLKQNKLEKRSRNLNLRSFKYSYDTDDFKPLGLQIFKERIKHKNASLEYIINEDLSPENNATNEKERTFYTANNDGELNPLIWEVDTCNITIGNFNYRKMSLVRDYNEIINAKVNSPIFEKLFNDLPQSKIVSKENYRLEENFPIISSDPTQTAAIQFARTGESYIIQGPPGTGKSQTITNLIADYIARDKKILFVCEKRAALDVVFHRLKNKNLDELCCLIHDSQTDKKAFIQNLKGTYEAFLKNEFSIEEIEDNRSFSINIINAEVQKLTYFHNQMKAGEVPPIRLFEVLNATGGDKETPSETERLYYPSYTEWQSHRDWIQEWIKQLEANGFEKYISKYAFCQISKEILEAPNPKTIVHERLDISLKTFDSFSENLEDVGVDESLTFEQMSLEFDLAQKVEGLARTNNLLVLDSASENAKKLQSALNEITFKEEKKNKVAKENENWVIKLSRRDLNEAINQWEKYQSSFLKIIQSGFYNLKNQINKAYNFEAHAIHPTIGSVLQKLSEEYQLEEEIANEKRKVSLTFGLVDYVKDIEWISNIQQKSNTIIKDWIKNDKSTYVLQLLTLKSEFELLKENVQSVFGNIQSLNLQSLESKLTNSQGYLSSLSVFIPFIQNAKNTSTEFQSVLFNKHWDIKTFEFNLAYKSLYDIYEKNPSFSEVDEDSLKASISKINQLFSDYYEVNVAHIRAKIRKQFLDKIRISESLAKQLTKEEKGLKKSYSSARRILENEFGKSMRYKSIRELASNEANLIMTSLKPVWLMSPLSVSDTMPIDASLFDVVIYDEASQITVEEGVPALFRTPQTIIVGDEMQMPPTNFFSSATYQDEEDDEIESTIGISLDADSLLNQGTRKLTSVMLGWHYRSRRESLISFSNAAFYKRTLLTIPDNIIHHEEVKRIEPILNTQVSVDIDDILNRSISFHHIENALYDNRKNKDEADYIANMVGQLLKNKTGKSIGIVAFSMQQQSEIEAALDRLAIRDEQFETLLEEEYQREDEGSFNGLFVKNLENVQGDERDIIIMSVCYGYNKRGSMLMNFGPINRRGGEKRLNVIFSRAKQHMVVVTSILPQEIKNDYNVGANYFKKFLSYAKHISDGKLSDASLILDGLYRYNETVSKNHDTVVLQLKSALEKEGYNIDLSIGQSHFKCDLGIKNSTNDKYDLGIILDNPNYYEGDDVIELYCQKPEILNAFGWKTINVYSKDWFEKPERVLEKIKQILEGKVPVEVIPEEIVYEKPEKEKSVEVIEEEPLITAVDVEELAEEKEQLVFERYEFKEGNSQKYWEVTVDDSTLIIQYGRIGNAPQVTKKTFATPNEAILDKEKRAAKKVAKGYVGV